MCTQECTRLMHILQGVGKSFVWRASAKRRARGLGFTVPTHTTPTHDVGCWRLMCLDGLCKRMAIYRVHKTDTPGLETLHVMQDVGDAKRVAVSRVCQTLHMLQDVGDPFVWCESPKRIAISRVCETNTHKPYT